MTPKSYHFPTESSMPNRLQIRALLHIRHVQGTRNGNENEVHTNGGTTTCTSRNRDSSKELERNDSNMHSIGGTITRVSRDMLICKQGQKLV